MCFNDLIFIIVVAAVAIAADVVAADVAFTDVAAVIADVEAVVAVAGIKSFDFNSTVRFESCCVEMRR